MGLRTQKPSYFRQDYGTILSIGTSFLTVDAAIRACRSLARFVGVSQNTGPLLE